MRTAIFDLETSSLYANSGIVLCACIKEYGKPGVKTIRADDYKSWESGKSDNSEVIKDILKALQPYDIFVAHSGQFFDKPFLTSSCLKYGWDEKKGEFRDGFNVSLRFQKFVDPVMLARRHMRIARNSLASILEYFDVEDTKTPIRFKYWMEAALDSNRRSLNYIVQHCVKDVLLLERAYGYTRKLSKVIDEQGSSR